MNCEKWHIQNDAKEGGTLHERIRGISFAAVQVHGADTQRPDAGGAIQSDRDRGHDEAGQSADARPQSRPARRAARRIKEKQAPAKQGPAQKKREVKRCRTKSPATAGPAASSLNMQLSRLSHLR